MDLLRFITTNSGKLKYQDFTSSGTFTPSAELLAKGGQCYIILIGGGGAGGSMNGSNSGYPGDAGQCRQELVTVSGAVTVTIGAGGAGVQYLGGNAGSNSTFGSLLTALGGAGGLGYPSGGVSAFTICGGRGALSLGSFHPDEGFTGTSWDARGGVGWSGRAAGGGGWAGSGGTVHSKGGDASAGSATNTTTTQAQSATANSGSGGAGCAGSFQSIGGNGGSGWCRVIWFE